LGVARIDRPLFPLAITVDDRHAMLPQRKLSAEPQLRIQARLSLSGEATAQPGDWLSSPVEVPSDTVESITLSLTTEVE
jgi:cytochrome c-type biogenesis protein CcmH